MEMTNTPEGSLQPAIRRCLDGEDEWGDPVQPASEGLEKTVSELKNSGADLRAIIDTSPALVCCRLPDGSKEFLNKQWRDYTGLPLEESYR